MDIRVDYYVQWEPAAGAQFNEPKCVRQITKCGEYAFVYGSDCGLPVKELRHVDKFFRVIQEYPGSIDGTEWKHFNTVKLVDNFLKDKFKRVDDYALIYHTNVRKNGELDEAQVAFLDSHHQYRRAKFTHAMRDELNTPAELKNHFRKLYDSR